MDSFELNKIAGAILFALLVTFGVSILSDIIFESEAPEVPGYVIAIQTETGDDGGATEDQPIAVLLASADAAAGQGVTRQCATCHTFGEGEPKKVGPNLWGIVNRPIATVPDFEYSPAMQEFAAQAGTWTFDHLNEFLHAPKEVVPGTLMNFPGASNDQQRANLILYLNSMSSTPAPLPEPTAAEAEPAEGAEAPVQTADAAEGTAQPGEATAPAPAADGEPAATAEAPQPATPEAATAEPQTAESAAPVADQPEAGEAQAEAPAAAAEPPATEAPAAEAPAAATATEEQVAQSEAPAEPTADATAEGAAAGSAGGETVAKRCAACHTFEKGAANKLGPNLWGVVNRPVASVPDYPYSPAMVEFSEGGAKTWTPDELNTYLTNPRETVPGSKMIFPGLPNEADRASLIAYLSTLAD